ncbi:MAG: 23S rRNA (pseudouridine(1915)-N(3))-methyltransferase RlmH [Candidatus Gracilibacteria bacterium]|nr:23S rRNA (pseudouridine(1915)-N(3))-methyltransferase RlmH [Candidatus Gracilibacteria bacterium]
MISIVTVSDSYTHFREPIEEYIRRLKGVVEVKVIKPEKSENPALIRQKESQRILELLGKQKGLIVYCDIGSVIFSTESLAEMVEKSKITHPNIVFIIGGAYGIDENILAPFIHKRISFSPMTFPHSLAFLIILEQLYRVEQIRKNTGYHHG